MFYKYYLNGLLPRSIMIVIITILIFYKCLLNGFLPCPMLIIITMALQLLRQIWYLQPICHFCPLQPICQLYSNTVFLPLFCSVFYASFLTFAIFIYFGRLIGSRVSNNNNDNNNNNNVNLAHWHHTIMMSQNQFFRLF